MKTLFSIAAMMGALVSTPAAATSMIVLSQDQMVDASVISQIRGLKQEFAENPYVPEF